MRILDYNLLLEMFFQYKLLCTEWIEHNKFQYSKSKKKSTATFFFYITERKCGFWCLCSVSPDNIY